MWWKTFLQPNCPEWPRRSCEQRCPIPEPLGSSSPKLVFGAFPLKTTFAVSMCIKALSKVPSHSCFLAPAQGSTGWLTSPVIRGKNNHRAVAEGHIASCILVSQRHPRPRK